MSKHDFSESEFSERRDRVREAIRDAGLDWFLVFHPVSIHWLTGSDAKSYQEFQCLIISAKEGPVSILTREGERNEFIDDALVDEVRAWGGGEIEDPLLAFQRMLEAHGVTGSRIGMEVPAYYLHPYDYIKVKEFLGSDLVAEPSTLIHDLKIVKSPTEITYIRKASEIADRAMEVFAQSLVVGRSELAVAGEVYRSLLNSGSGLAASPINLVSGERSGFSHGAPTERLLQKSDFGSVEYGATYRRYTATIGRQFCMGTPTARMQQIFDVVRAACDACIEAIRPGVPAQVPHEAAKKVIQDAGFERGRVHTSGYGLAPGFPPTWGEPLHMLSGSTYTIQAGMVLTVEPPIFLGEEYLGARIIDNVLVTENGAELLSHYRRDIIQI
jgi:Xaa-Pro dipeptidase